MRKDLNEAIQKRFKVVIPGIARNLKKYFQSQKPDPSLRSGSHLTGLLHFAKTASFATTIFINESHHPHSCERIIFMTNSTNWHPTASFEHLKLRSQILATIRIFFAERNVWEVDTPLLAQSTATDPHISSLTVPIDGKNSTILYLQTSPEFAMKRLLAAGSGSIYQISKAFRAEEKGRLHHTEFTLLEWYRVGFDHHQLMDEMDALLHRVLKTKPSERLSYTNAFKKYLNIDPLRADVKEFMDCAHEHELTKIQTTETDDTNFWLHLLMSHLIEPHLGKDKPTFITDFPAQQAALAKIRDDNPPVAERFEVYFKGIELANGYHELTDAAEQKKRFLSDNQQRKELGLPQIPIDEYLLAALESGFPNCAGVALGIDRLVMLAAGVSSIAEVMSFL